MTQVRKPAASGKEGLHPRNKHRDPYDFTALVKACPELARHLVKNVAGAPSIDFAKPEAVLALNRALLAHFYGIKHWSLPPGYLCPPIPGRVDYLHHAADLLSGGDDSRIPRGSSVRVLDIGTGANCIYPILGHQEYGWSFVATDIDAGALKSARRIVGENPSLSGFIECRQQHSPKSLFHGVLNPGERFDLSLCNPPFHSSAEEAQSGTIRKLRNLAARKISKNKAVLNFGGQGCELWCPGGELSFVRRMISESAQVPQSCRWFTSLIAKSAHLSALEAALKDARARQIKIIAMSQGQKKSRILAWSFEES